MYIKDLSLHPLFGVAGYKAIGYLEGEYQKGSVPSGFIEKLATISDKIFSTHGWHDCPYCRNAKSSSDIAVGGYVWPQMLSHYVKVHNYQPPQEFIDFVMNYVKPKKSKKPFRRVKLPDFDF